MTYVLFLLLWNASANSSHYVTTQEFLSKQRCEDAGQAATNTFGGYGVRPYWICVQK